VRDATLGVIISSQLKNSSLDVDEGLVKVEGRVTVEGPNCMMLKRMVGTRRGVVQCSSTGIS
jgi:hypothetical protein